MPRRPPLWIIYSELLQRTANSYRVFGVSFRVFHHSLGGLMHDDQGRMRERQTVAWTLSFSSTQIADGKPVSA